MPAWGKSESQGEVRTATQWLSPSGRAVKLANVKVTSDRTPVAAVVGVHARGMKDAWHLATSRSDLSGAQAVKAYGKRFTIEETFRDAKDARFGMGLKATHIADPERRDRLLLLAAISQALLTLLGAALGGQPNRSTADFVPLIEQGIAELARATSGTLLGHPRFTAIVQDVLGDVDDG